MAMKWNPHKKYGPINLGFEPTNCQVLQDLIVKIVLHFAPFLNLYYLKIQHQDVIILGY